MHIPRNKSSDDMFDYYRNELEAKNKQLEVQKKETEVNKSQATSNGIGVFVMFIISVLLGISCYGLYSSREKNEIEFARTLESLQLKLKTPTLDRAVTGDLSIEVVSEVNKDDGVLVKTNTIHHVKYVIYELWPNIGSPLSVKYFDQFNHPQRIQNVSTLRILN